MKGTPGKKWLFVAGALVAGYVLFRGKNLINDLQVRVLAFGKPSIKSGVLSLPIQIAINNSNAFSIPVDNLTTDIFLQTKSGEFLKVGSTRPTGQFKINTGETDLIVQPQINFSAFGNSVFNALNTLLNSNPVVKAITTAKVKGIDVVDEKTLTLA
jgi:hypothetical protein